MTNIHQIEKNIYITNDEKIKEGDWMIRGNEQPTLVTPNFFWDFGVRYYKIILTTDQDLVGIQAIDEEFLEFIVKNPSCEYIETEYWCKACDITQEMSFGKCHESHKHCSCIVRVTTDNYEIPKEEPKPMLTNEEYEFCMHKKGMSGSFMESLIQTMYKADIDNLNLLGKGYPGLAQVVKRYQTERGYWKDVVARWNEENPHSLLVA